MNSVCVGCREDTELPFSFKMAFQPIVDMAAQRVWGYEALVRGVNGESANDVDTLAALIKRLPEGMPLVVRVERQGALRYLVLRGE